MKLEIGKTYLYRYRESIDRGNIVAGIEMITLLDKLLAEIGEPEYEYDTVDALRRMHFMENCIRLTKSPFYGKPMILMLWQKAFIEAAYSFKMSSTGFDRFKKILFLIARKNTKSETCSALANSDMILGPCGSDIVCASNDDNQSSIVYEAIDTMRQLMDPADRDTWRNQKGIKCFETASKIFKMSDRMRNKEGRNIDVGYVDEAHEMLDDSIVKPIEQSQSLKDNPKLFVLTTEGFVNSGYLDGLLIYARRVLSGEDDGPAAKRFLPWLYTQDSEQEVWQDPRSWEKSNPTLGTVKKREYIVEQLDLASKSKSDRMYVLAKDFNIKQSNAQAWLMAEDYAYDATFDLEGFRGALCLGAVDLAETTDLTNAKVLLMRAGDPVKYVHSHYWIPESKLAKTDDEGSGARYRDWCDQGLMTITEGNDVDLSLVADWFYTLYKEFGFRLMMCGYDQKFSKQFLKRMDDYGFEVEIVWQNKYTLSQPMKLVEADFLDQQINYNNNPVDAWCLGNTAMKIDDQRLVMPVKIGGQASRRIDGAATLIDLYEIYRRYRTEFTQNLEQ